MATAALTVVGLVALAAGTAAATTVQVRSGYKSSGTVASANGTSAPDSCGTAGSPGDFVLTSKGPPFTVDVGDPSTTFKDHGVATPSFADVCVGDKVRALGTISADDVVTATEVVVIPPRAQKVSGTVASVYGTSTCGKSGVDGAFTVSSHSTAFTVDVGNPSTTFRDHGVATPSLADVCVGDKVRALGTISPGHVVTASDVTVVLPSK
jgi:endonuclease YncB( thermonuclease family)